MAVRLGMNASLYRGTAGTTADTLIANITDVTLDLSQAEADVTTRGNEGWRATVGTLKEGTVEFEMIWDEDDDDFQAFFDAWMDNTAIALLVLSAPIADGGEGLNADFTVVNLSRSEPLEEAIRASVTCKPTYSTRAPAWYANGS